MTTTRLFIVLSGLFIASEFVACIDHRIPVVTPGVNRLRVKTITQQLTASASLSTVSAFTYDQQGRLSLISAYQLPDSTAAPVENTLYTYDAQNRLTQVQHSVVRRGSAAETYTLTYNAIGQVAGAINLPSTFSIGFQYNAANQPSTFSRGYNTGGLQYSGGGAFTYTGNNVTSKVETISIIRLGGPPVDFGGKTATTYTFDDKINPFYGVFIIPAPGVFLPPNGTGVFGPFYTLYGGIDNPLNLSQNNVLSAANATGTTTSYSYSYNAANLPISRTTTTNNAVTETLRYDYESY